MGECLGGNVIIKLIVCRLRGEILRVGLLLLMRLRQLVSNIGGGGGSCRQPVLLLLHGGVVVNGSLLSHILKYIVRHVVLPLCSILLVEPWLDDCLVQVSLLELILLPLGAYPTILVLHLPCM